MEDALRGLLTAIPYTFLRVERGALTDTSANLPKALQISQIQTFVRPTTTPGSTRILYPGGVAMVAIMLTGVMFPLWRPIMRIGVCYLSLGVLGLSRLFFAIAVLRLNFYTINVFVTSPGMWIFLKLCALVGFASLAQRLPCVHAYSERALSCPSCEWQSTVYYRSSVWEWDLRDVET